jgi:hypothetical protein
MTKMNDREKKTAPLLVTKQSSERRVRLASIEYQNHEVYGLGHEEPDLSLDKLRTQYHDIVSNEIESLLEAASKHVAVSGPRLSDAFLAEKVGRRLFAVWIDSATTPSIHNDPVICNVLDDDRNVSYTYREI